MKKLFILLLFWCLFSQGFCQFTAMPLNYPHDGSAYMSWFTSIVDANTVWVGTVRQGTSGYLPYASAVKTDDGGNTWQFFPIPVTGTPWIQHLAAWDANTCYYLFTDGSVGGGSVWKTSDGGTTWTKKTTTQFAGGWSNFIHLFSQDTCLVMGDPSNGYFEIQLSDDGGGTWTRVPSTDMPAIISGETGLSGEYSAIGNNIWFGTSKGRCFKSIDKGLHWTVSTVASGYGQSVCFSDALHGFFYAPGTSTFYYKTDDGGSTWSQKSIKPGNFFGHMCRVPGLNNAYVLCTWKNTLYDSMYVFSSYDFFNTMTVLDSNITNSSGFPNFNTNNIGWLGGSYYYYHDIYKFNGVLTSVPQKGFNAEAIEIWPNPSSEKSSVKIHSVNNNCLLRILDFSGKEVGTLNIGKSMDVVDLNANQYKSGVYLIQLVHGNMVICNKKWIVIH